MMMRVQMKCMIMQSQDNICHLKVKIWSAKKGYCLGHFCQFKFKDLHLRTCIFKLLKTDILLYHPS